MGEDDFRGHAAKDEGHGDAEQDEVVISKQGGGGGPQPAAAAGHERNNRCPFEEDGEHGESIALAGYDDVIDAERQVSEEEGANEKRDPDVDEGVVVDEGLEADGVLHGN